MSSIEIVIIKLCFLYQCIDIVQSCILKMVIHFFYLQVIIMIGNKSDLDAQVLHRLIDVNKEHKAQVSHQ